MECDLRGLGRGGGQRRLPAAAWDVTESGAAGGTRRSRGEAGISFWSSSSTSRSFGGGIHRGAHAWLRAEWVREMNAVCKKARELRWRGVELFIHSNEAVGDRLVGNWTWSISPLRWRWRCVGSLAAVGELWVFLCIFNGSVPLPVFILTLVSQRPRETERTFKTGGRHQRSSTVFTDSCTPSSAVEICLALPLSFITDAHNHSPKFTPSIKSWNKKVNTSSASQARQLPVLLLCQSEPTASKSVKTL